tara:strand:+ start:1758 stop:2261 length:504 start_codon:yes stop_codon:yes gene_type:complete
MVKIPIASTATKLINRVHKMFKMINRGLFHNNAKVVKKSGKGAAKLLNKVGKLSKPVRLDNGAIQYSIKGASKGLVVVTGTGGKILKKGGDAIGSVVGGVKNLSVVVLKTSAGSLNKLTRGVLDLRGGRKSRRKRRRKSKKSRRKRKKTRRKRRRKGKKSRRRRRRR